MPLAITYAKLRREIGRFLGYGRDPSVWTGDKAYMSTDVEDILEAGLRRFYWPVITIPSKDKDGTPVQERYSWSFLSPNTTLSISNGTHAYDLPSDFTDMASETFAFAVSSGLPSVTRTNVDDILGLRAQAALTGPPQYYAISTKSVSSGNQTAYEVLFYPTPGTSYTLTYSYSITPPLIDGTNTYPLGGPQNSELVLEACLSEAEKMLDDTDGLHEKRFRELLEAAVAVDRSIEGSRRDAGVWPSSNLPSDLTVNRAYLRRMIGTELGYGPNPGAWTNLQSGVIGTIMERGLRRFYWPMARKIGKGGVETMERYSWSFLTARATISAVINDYNYDLPTDFTDITSEGISYSAGVEKPRMTRITSEQLDALRAQSNTTGAPQYFSIQAKDNSSGTRTRYQVCLHPTPDASYTLRYAYSITPPLLTNETDVPYGGPQHSECIIEACMAEVELSKGVEGPHEKRFRELLEAEIMADRNINEEVESDEVWDTTAISSTLSVTKAYLKRLIGREFGYGAHSGVWTAFQQREINLALETGLRKFYSPQVLPGEKYSHDWSFLRPLSTFSTVANTYIYALPADFALIEGDQILFAPGGNVIYQPIRITSERIVMQNHERSDATGRPLLAAIRPKSLVEANGTRYELVLYPTPDDAYDMTYTYTINPSAISTETALPFGGQPHMQTIVEACLCAVEEMSGKRGVHSDAFITCLRASVSHDRKVLSPDTLGFNRPHEIYDPRDCGVNIITYNGVEY